MLYVTNIDQIIMWYYPVYHSCKLLKATYNYLYPVVKVIAVQ